MRILTLLLAAIALSGCATATPAGTGGVPGDQRASEQDCAVFAAIARQHYRFTDPASTPRVWSPVRMDNGDTYAVECDWAGLNVPIPGTTDPTLETPLPGRPIQWVKFERPVYGMQSATVQTGILHGPLAGSGFECDLVSGVAGWTVRECRQTWIS